MQSKQWIPRPVQNECLDKLEARLREGATGAVIGLPTGQGKTGIAAFFVQKRRAGGWKRVLFLCHQNYILKQACGTFQEILGTLKMRHVYNQARLYCTEYRSSISTFSR